MDEPAKQGEIRNPDGTFKEGVSGNPAGRPKGKTMKEFAREYYMKKTDEEKIAYIENLEKLKPGFAWQMGEGNPETKSDLTSGGKPIIMVAGEIAGKYEITPTNEELQGE